ncbi:putative IQ motif, EF-hand binding, P-loop containing nucleoside triphosphate hydrolase [Rosa chinensis]|uniref:Putative IQ motif, EF-hand binding, P-loop containing nucleoside triphosphate hydrolase n=1 Tax=Rosa chinensis TaxID=74649 RepID=A0A2P6SMX8_ROSCH|nr:protein IQ-DOMAIN 14 [Rosa chinensis]PRQ60044.1 putative IQ motif, EF-hand binding, P-loop containing nucleoside triphosphate hydrolase [Rosa chinensis]
MGFFRRLFGPKKPKKKTNKAEASTSASQEWGLDSNKHAIAVAAATAAVAEAALAAAHAAAEVVRLTNGVETSGNVSLPVRVSRHRHLAAVKIQSAFRRYLARRALRALKALVKLQALVRGHIVRKQTADMLRRMQTLVRLQARARATRSLMSESVHSSSKSSLSYNPLPESPDKLGYQHRVYSSKFDGPSLLKRCGSNSNARDATSLDRRRLASGWLDRWMEESVWNNRRDASSLRYVQADNEKVDKILEVDTWKPHLGSQRNTRAFQTAQRVMASDNYSPMFMTFDSPSKRTTKEPNLIPSQSSMDYFSSSSMKYPIGKDEVPALRTAQNSPQAFSASSRPGSSSARRGHFTPTRSEYSWGFFSSYAGYPSYMANTESSRAKVRSQSAPRQRLEFDKYSLTKKSVQDFCEAGTCSETGLAQDTDFRNKAFLSSTHSNRLR